MLRSNQPASTLRALALFFLFLVLTFTTILSGAQSESVLYSFPGGPGGAASPNSGLISGPGGFFYGTTAGGGAGGTVFKLFRSGGTWMAASIHNFNGADGNGPQGSLLMDSAGNLYGTTATGGNYGSGVVFELEPVSGGWDYFVLHNFNFDGVNNFDGFQPVSNLVLDTKGRLYGTTKFGGSGQCFDTTAAAAPKGAIPTGCGTVFQLTPHPGGSWSEKILYSFQGGADGALPFAGLARDSSGIFYGTTFEGGIPAATSCNSKYATGCGVVFSLAPQAGGWIQKVVYAFQAQADGANPTAPVIFDRAGNIYGTTSGVDFGDDFSTVFELTPSTGGVWNEHTLFAFAAGGDGTGTNALGGLIFDAAGNLYGTAFYGNGASTTAIAPPKSIGGGVVYKLAPTTSGPWTQSVLHTFTGSPDGYHPGYGSLVLRGGALYGTTTMGGTGNAGGVFSVAP